MYKQIIFFLTVASLLFSCKDSNFNQQISSNYPIEIKEIITRGENHQGSSNLHKFLKDFEQGKNTKRISETNKKDYIVKALEKLEMYGYQQSNSFNYYHGGVVYKSEDFVALTFTCQGQDERNEISAFYMATYSLQNNELIDCRVINSFSEFDLKDSKGYSLNEILTHDIEVVNNNEVSLKISCNNKIRYYGIDKDAVDQKENIDINFVYKLNTEGRFSINKV